jgi:hypothetical protein
VFTEACVCILKRRVYSAGPSDYYIGLYTYSDLHKPRQIHVTPRRSLLYAWLWLEAPVSWCRQHIRVVTKQHTSRYRCWQIKSASPRLVADDEFMDAVTVSCNVSLNLRHYSLVEYIRHYCYDIISESEMVTDVRILKIQ